MDHVKDPDTNSQHTTISRCSAKVGGEPKNNRCASHPKWILLKPEEVLARLDRELGNRGSGSQRGGLGEKGDGDANYSSDSTRERERSQHRSRGD